MGARTHASQTSCRVSQRITLGFIGMGKIGKESHLRVFSQHAQTHVLAVCDVESGRLDESKKIVEEAYAKQSGKGTYQGCAAYGDFRELLDRRDVDAVLMNNTTGNLFLPHPKELSKLSAEEKEKAKEYDALLKKSFTDFVTNGGGLIGIHAATDCHTLWPEYGEMIGGRFWGHPWSESVTIKIDDPAHPLCRAFKGSSFVVADEMYQFNEPYSRQKLRVLSSLDTARTNMDKGEAVRRTDGDFAVSWVRRYGKGKVFYCSLGHMHDIFWNPVVLEHYLDGIQFALGDLDADTTPSAKRPVGGGDQRVGQSTRPGRGA